MEIDYYRKNIYGNELMYVANVETAKKLSWLLNTKTISTEQMNRLTALFGVEWNEVLAPKP